MDKSFSTTKMQPLRSLRNKPSIRERYLRGEKDRKNEKKTVALNIYAELSRKNYQQILNNELEICVPYGVKMRNKGGSRVLFFECEDEDAVKELIDGLDASEISWQEV